MDFRKIKLISLFVALTVLMVGGATAYTALTTPPQPAGYPNGARTNVSVFFSQFHARGKFVKGHSKLACQECHRPSAGSVRQQLQALAKNALFDVGYEVDFGFQKVHSEQCLVCHNRDNDRHPIHRFNEPRFIDVVKELPANQCIGCHSEHNGRTVNLKQVGFCKSCHSDLVLKNEPLDISHSHLVQSEDWGSCLGCHDFHGNHKYEEPKLYQEAISIGQIEAYFAGGLSPYGMEKYHEGLKE